jgi:hypothetical protein
VIALLIALEVVANLNRDQDRPGLVCLALHGGAGVGHQLGALEQVLGIEGFQPAHTTRPPRMTRGEVELV